MSENAYGVWGGCPSGWCWIGGDSTYFTANHESACRTRRTLEAEFPGVSYEVTDYDPARVSAGVETGTPTDAQYRFMQKLLEGIGFNRASLYWPQWRKITDVLIRKVWIYYRPDLGRAGDWAVSPAGQRAMERREAKCDKIRPAKVAASD